MQRSAGNDNDHVVDDDVGSLDSSDSLREWAAPAATYDDDDANADAAADARGDDAGRRSGSTAGPRQARPLLALDADERELLGAAVQLRLHLPAAHTSGGGDKVAQQQQEHGNDSKSGVAAPHDSVAPGALVVERVYYMGQSIEYVKMQLEELDGLPYERTQLYLHGTLLLDPLSLNDYAFRADEVNDVDVVVVASPHE